MDSWSNDCEGKGLLFIDEWDLKPSTDFEAVEGMEFMDFGFADMKKKPFFGNTSLGIFGDEFGNDTAKRLVSSDCMITTSSYYGEKLYGSKHSSSLMESNCQDSSLIDLNLGRLTDSRDSKDCKFLKETMSKKAPTTSSYSHTPRCQVYGCNKDLSLSKDYYKRNKVCETHSKTAKVIVNEIEMRFCQQCSRFHLLAEFDDGKRSCRKRLVGHNERRRKLHFSTLSGKSHKLRQSYQGRYEHANQVKSEEKPVYNPQSAISIINGQLLPKSFFHMYGNEKHYIPGNFSSATEAFNAPNAASMIKELSGVTRSDCALSLLSAQSQDLSSHATGILMTKPFINQAGHPHYNSGKSAAVCSLEKGNGFHSCGMNPMGVGQAEPVVVSDAVNIEVLANGYFQDSGLSSRRHCLSPETGTTVDLLQLSTHLQRVEQQRSLMHVMPENEDLCYFLTT